MPEKRAWDQRIGEYGRSFRPESPTDAAAVLEFRPGMVGTFTAASDGHGYFPSIRVVGTDGILDVPDPNMFAREVRITRRGTETAVIPLLYGFSENSRGLGLAEMIRAIAEDRPHRANDEVAYHVLETLPAIGNSSQAGARVSPASSCTRPTPMPELTADDPLFV